MKLKSGKITKLVSVRVPENKAKIAKKLIKEFVEIIFVSFLKSKKNLLEKVVKKVLKDLENNHLINSIIHFFINISF